MVFFSLKDLSCTAILSVGCGVALIDVSLVLSEQFLHFLHIGMFRGHRVTLSVEAHGLGV